MKSHLPLWKAVLDEPLRSRAQEAALLVANRMVDPEEVQRVAQLARQQSPHTRRLDLSFPWAAAELSLFYSSVAHSFPEDRWRKSATRYLKLIGDNSQRHSLTSPSLFGGISGVAFVIQQLSGGVHRYQRTLLSLYHSLAQQVNLNSRWRRPIEMDVAESDFDVIRGVAGIVGSLASFPDQNFHVKYILHTLIDYLLALLEPGQTLGQERWRCSPSQLKTQQERDAFPHGRFNCGFAHGLPGIVAALALTKLSGYDAPGIEEALTSGCLWLLQHQLRDAWGITWPVAIPYELASTPEAWRTLPGSRTAWCYGIPGIARSLWLAGLALQDASLLTGALEAFRAVFDRPGEARNINAPTLCHGMAGLLLICLHIAQESQDTCLLKQIPQLVEEILTHYDPHSPLGFRNIDSGGILVDCPSLLMGAPGTALALLAAASDVAPGWDRLLLLS